MKKKKNRLLILFVMVCFLVGCKSNTNLRLSYGGFNYDSFENTIRAEEFKASYTNNFRDRNDEGSSKYIDEVRLIESQIYNFEKGGKKVMENEIGNLMTQITSVIAGLYALTKTIIAIVKKIKH